MKRCTGWTLAAMLSMGAACGRMARAQEPPCGLREVRETVAPLYPPIARAAHVSGVVVVLATFDLAGNVTEAHATSGPKMLQAAAETFVRGWKANEYGGSRSCGVAIEYALENPPICSAAPTPGAPTPVQGRVDPLHYEVVGRCAIIQAISDPSPIKVWRHKWLGIRF